MLSTGSYVIYGSNGICRITDKRQEKLCGTKKEYYVLTPADNPGSMIFVPCDNEELISRIKSLLSKEEILALIKSIGENDIAWINDNKKRLEVFSGIVDGGDRSELLKLIKCIYLKRKEFSANNKKLWQADENILKRAEKIINAEFSLVMEIPAENVPMFIESHLTNTL